MNHGLGPEPSAEGGAGVKALGLLVNGVEMSGCYYELLTINIVTT